MNLYFSVSSDDDCDYNELKEGVEDIKGNFCEVNTYILLQNLLSASNNTQVWDKVKQLCCLAVSHTLEVSDFSKITKKDWKFDNKYYEGGTYFNYEIENNSGNHCFKNNSSHINCIHQDKTQSKAIDLPAYLNAVDRDQDDCGIDALFCCWVQDW